MKVRVASQLDLPEISDLATESSFVGCILPKLQPLIRDVNIDPIIESS